MLSVLIVIQLVVSVALIITVLLQRSEGGALGMGGGGAGLGGLFTPRGAADTLTRTTAILAIMFFATSLALTLVALHTHPVSILESPANTQGQSLPLQRPAAPPSKPQQQLPSVPIPHE